MLNQQILKGTGTTVDETAVVINDIYVENPQNFAQGAEAYYTGILQSLQPGVHEIILHAAYDNSEMQAITTGHPDYGAAWRQADFNFFTSELCKTLLQQNRIQLITWREIRDKLVRKEK
jgi:hypothetical protein